ncbi:16S rRNA (cytidine(1402)-2'-O)-methyltransferase [bacterium]|nr:16S rRNA (cytidine(1402)-2'-O)-methyltransferase [bacterium]
MRSVSQPERAVKLFLVSTPIGNLGDFSPRGIEVLKSVDYILCEDTRRAQKLQARFNFKSRLVSFHEHNERKRLPKIISLMKNGKTFALISDAGSPLLSDPGYTLVQNVIQEDIPFTCIPGPSAVTTALLLSGFQLQQFTFAGFLPVKPGARLKALQKLAELKDQTLVLFESPERVHGLLREISEVLGNRNLALCREMTKMHEEVLRGTASDLLKQLADRKWTGECTVVVAPGEEKPIEISDETIQIRFDELVRQGLSRKDAIQKLTRETGRSRNELYDLVHHKK